jgi:glutamyl/glutaminyl-tRNA synthetase
MIESEMEKYIWSIFKWKSPELIHGGMLRIEGTSKLSKSKAQKEVMSGEFSGWDDPRTWSVQSLKRRGFLPETIREFIESIGLNQNDIVVPIDNLYAINRKLVHEKAEKIQYQDKPETQANAKILLPDGKWIYVLIQGELKPNKIYHLLGLGYCRLDNCNEKYEFWFTHP